MEKSRVDAVTEQPTPQSVREIQVFQGFANFYRRFIKGYSKIIKPITDLLKKSSPFIQISEAGAAFQLLKTVFTTTLILRHYDPELRIIVETDVSGYATAAILSQFISDGDHIAWHLVVFFSKKMSDIETRYNTHDKELLAIILAFRNQRYYLAYTKYTIIIKTDYNNLKYFLTKRNLNSRQIRWA